MDTRKQPTKKYIMKKINEIIGIKKGGRCLVTLKSETSYAWHNSTSNKQGRKNFTLYLSPNCLDILRYRSGDRCDIYIDDSAMTATIMIGKDGDYAISGAKNSIKRVQIAGAGPCEYLSRIFVPCESIQGLETISSTLIPAPSITVKLNPA